MLKPLSIIIISSTIPISENIFLLEGDYTIEAETYMKQIEPIDPSSLESLVEQIFIQEVIRQMEVDQFSP